MAAIPTRSVPPTTNKVTVSLGTGATAASVKVGGIWGGGAVDTLVTGGLGDATGNEVDVSGGTIGTGGIRGGVTFAGAASGNTVKVSGGVNLDLSGSGNIYGGYSYDVGAASDNKVNVSNVNATNQEIYGGYSKKGSTDDNEVKLDLGAGQSARNIYGGYTESATTTDSADGNTVTITGSGTILGEVAGGNASVAGSAASANKNTVSITGVGVNFGVFGGSGLNGNANNNTGHPRQLQCGRHRLRRLERQQ